MNILKRFGPGLLAVAAPDGSGPACWPWPPLALALEAADRAGVPHLSGFVGPAAAIVGRPLTPVSYAGVARRTARRCAVGVYYC
jgi:hypothetical protein